RHQRPARQLRIRPGWCPGDRVPRRGARRRQAGERDMAVSMDGQLAVRAILPGAGHRGAMPPPAPLPMPAQELRERPPARFAEQIDFRAVLARAITLSGTVAIVAYGVSEMIGIVRNDDMSTLQVLMIVFFGL